MRLEGPLDTVVTGDLAGQVLAVLREALSNIVRHAKATRADVLIETRDGELTLLVTDNGVGIPEGGRRSGLRNLAERAENLGGTFSAESGGDGGSRLRWRVPLRPR